MVCNASIDPYHNRLVASAVSEEEVCVLLLQTFGTRLNTKRLVVVAVSEIEGALDAR